jgi:replicative DNA helicase
MSRELLRQGVLVPQAIELEEAVLGACLIDGRAILSAVKHVRTPEFFYKPEHSKIYAAMLELHSEKGRVDMLMVDQKLKAMGCHEQVGGFPALMKLSQRVNSSAHIEHHGLILLEKYMLRRIISLSATMSNAAFDPDVDVLQLLESFRQGINEVETATMVANEKHFSEVLKLVMEDVQRLSESNVLSGIPTGFRELDRTTGGWQKGEMIVIGARPGMGKTAFALRTILEATNHTDAPIVMVNYEMRDVAQAKRIVSIESKSLHSNQLFREGLKKDQYWKEFIATIGRLENKNIKLLDHMPNIHQLAMDVRRIHNEQGIGLLVIDYLQLVPSASKKFTNNRENDVSEISREIKKISLELNVPVIALSQLSREVEKRPSKVPKLSDLRESGSLEQDADMVAFLMRPSMYFEDADINTALFITEKQRNGALGTIEIGWDANRVRFYDKEVNYGGADASKDAF